MNAISGEEEGGLASGGGGDTHEVDARDIKFIDEGL